MKYEVRIRCKDERYRTAFDGVYRTSRRAILRDAWRLKAFNPSLLIRVYQKRSGSQFWENVREP